MIFSDLHSFLLGFFHTITQILTAGIAITAFSLILHVLTFNLRERVTQSFAIILACVAVVFTGDAIASEAAGAGQIEFWLKIQWTGIIFLGPAYLNFSDALLALTGKPSRWRRFWAVRASFLAALVFLVLLLLGHFAGELVTDRQPAPHFSPTLITGLFSIYYLGNMAMAWYNFYRAYNRTTTPTSRRRLGYLITGAFGPAVGSFPFLLFSTTFASQFPVLFWMIASLTNFLLGGLVVVMAYAVAFFGVPWPDRVIKSRILKWIMRGPVTASFVLAVTTIVRRLGVQLNVDVSALVPIVMTLTILIFEYLITIFAPVLEQSLFWGNDRGTLEELRRLEDRLVTPNDLRQFLEMILAAVSDGCQAGGAYIAVLDEGKVEMLVTVGKPDVEIIDRIERIDELDESQEIFHKNGSFFLPLMDDDENGETGLSGLLGITGVAAGILDNEQSEAVRYLAKRASKALHDRKQQSESFEALQRLAPEADMIQLLRAQGTYDSGRILQEEISGDPEDVSVWVKEALTHYWGGPKLTQNPLLKLKIVQDVLDENEGNPSNALRAVLKKAIEQTRPAGERRFTGEWILYNILEMKFLEGRKVREVAARLAMSEADLYRKQRIAIETVAKTILAMEEDVNGSVSK